MKSRKWFAGLIVLTMALLLLPALVLRRPNALPTLDPLAWAQVSSCGNAILEPGEQCDPPGSISCPPGSPAGAILPCNAECMCPPVAASLDHFQCYAIKPRHSGQTDVTVVDRFGTLSERLRFPDRLCVPADKNDEGISNPSGHLVGYSLKAPRNPRFQKRTDETVVNQFGTLQLDVLRPSRLLVPSSKDGVPQTGALDHFQCYVVKNSKGGPKFMPRTVTVSSQIETVTLQVVRPFRLCVPADKNGEDPTAPSHPDELLCYKTQSGRFGDETHTIANQFGQRDVTIISRNELCVPSSASAVTTTTTSTTAAPTTSSTTSTTVANSSSTSTTGPNTTSTSTTTSTTTTLYGSPSRAFLQRSGSLLD